MDRALADLVSGTTGGIAQVLVGHPFDTIRVRLQTTRQYSGLVDCARRTILTEGIRGLYKGAASPLLGLMFHNAGIFFSYGQAKLFVCRADQQLSISKAVQAGALTGTAVAFIETPIDLFKCKLQVQTSLGSVSGMNYRSAFHAATSISRMYGIRGVYQGLCATLLRNIPCFGLYFGAFEGTKRFLAPESSISHPPPSWVYLLAGGAAGLGFWATPFYPLDLVRTRLQADHSDPVKRRYSSYFDCFRSVYRDGGYAGLYCGFLTTIIRAIIVNAAVFTVVSYTGNLFQQGKMK